MTNSISARSRKTAAMRETMPDDLGGSSVNIAVTGISRSEDGAFVTVSITLSCGKKRDRRAFLLPVEDFVSLGLRRGEISPETFELTEKRAKLCEACRRGENILGYGANSGKRLEMKLRRKGFDAETAGEAVERLTERGYIDEYSDALRAARRSAAGFHGPRLIASQLIAKGYGRDTVEAVLSSMDDIDFTRLCSDFIRKKYDPFPTERKERDKAFATLMRRGYPSSTLREALTLIKNETDT